MSHPPGPPQDPYLPDPEPQWYPDPSYADPTASTPYPPASAGYPPPAGSPYPPGQPDPTRQMPPGMPYPTSGPPGYPPTSGAPYPPVSGGGYPPPVSGSPLPPPGGAYPGGYPPPVSGSPLPPPGGAYPPGPQLPPPAGPYPGLPLPPQGKSSGGAKTTLIVVAVVAVVLTLLCCVGGVVALMSADVPDTDDGIARPPTPGASVAPLTEPTQPLTAPPTGADPEPTDGETFNMKVGDTLVITDDDGTIEITINKFTTSTKGCVSYAPDPDEGMYLIANVTARVTKGTASINPFFFEWVGEDGTTANGLVGTLSGCGTPLASGVNLRSGSKRAGTVVFDVANKKGTVEYKHNFEVAGSWRP